MEVRFAALADYAAVDQQGRFNIIGLFTEHYVQAFPVQIANLHVALSFRTNALEAGATKQLQVVLQDADGKTIIQLDGQVAVPPPVRPGRPSHLNLCLGIHNLSLASEGEYQATVLIDGDVKAVLEFAVLQVSPS